MFFLREMGRLLIAIEYEKGLHTLDGMVLNEAPQFLNHPLNEKKRYVQEGTNHQNEYNSPPRDSLYDVCHDLLDGDVTSKKMCADIGGAINIPVSEMGAGKSEANPHPRIVGRTTGYIVIFGPGSDEILTKISGVHSHIDQGRGCSERKD